MEAVIHHKVTQSLEELRKRYAGAPATPCGCRRQPTRDAGFPFRTTCARGLDSEVLKSSARDRVAEVAPHQ